MPPVADPDLAATGRSLVDRLGGRWTGRGGMCRCPAHQDRTPSLSVRVGDYGLLFHCFAGCPSGRVAAAIAQLDRRALSTAGERATLSGNGPAGPSPRIRQLWEEAVRISGSPAELYLAGRSLVAPRTGLRFHPRTPLGARDMVRFRPAILAAVQQGAALVALHRTFLSGDCAGLATDLENPRLMLGRPGRGALRPAPAAGTLGVAEGMETALSAMRLLGVPVWAALGAERLPSLTIPLGVRRLLILADDDAAGRRAAAVAAVAHARAGLQICRLWPGRGFNDWNDRLRAGGEGAGGGCGERPDGRDASTASGDTP